MAERDRELLDRNKHQPSKDKERYQELSNHFNQEKAKHAELIGTLAALQKRGPPDPWDNVDPGTPSPSYRV
eukprot:11569439-Prorocentrum_lima.AAC.1